MVDHTARFSPQSSIAIVVGLGKIGLPLAAIYAQSGLHVIGCDSNPTVVEMVNAGISHVSEEPELEAMVAAGVERKMLSATTYTTEAVRCAKVVVVIVPVLIDERHEVDFRSIDAATEAIAAGLQPGTLIIYESTLPVGTTKRRFASILERISRLRAGQDFLLAYSPERVSSGHIFRDLRTYPKIVGGINACSTTAAVSFYQTALDAQIMTMASTDEAEFVKLIETTYRDVNIALANEYACYADTHGLNVMAAITAANTQPYSHIHTPGVGVGGHCIPVYPYFLLSTIEEGNKHGQQFLLPHIARRVNDAMAMYAVRRIEAITGPVAGHAVLILGVAYRGDVREVSFTSAKLLQDALVEHGAEVYVDDPLFSAEELYTLGYVPLPVEVEGKVQAIILQADHKAYRSFDWDRFTGCQVVLDGRGALTHEKVEAAGMRYISIGDGAHEWMDGHATPSTPTSMEWR